MSIASLTIDLVMNLAKFEGDSGKAAAIVTRDSEKMERAQLNFLRSLERSAERAGKTSTEYLTLKAAQLGVSAAAEKYIEVIAAAGASQEASVSRQKAGFSELVASINQVSAAAAKRRAELIADEKLGKISPAQLSTSLTGLNQHRDDAVAQLKAYADQQAAARETANVEVAAVAKRMEAFQRLRDTVAKLNYQNDQRAAQQAASGAQKEAAAAAQFVAALEAESSAIGKTRSELLALKAAKLGVADAAAPLISQIAQAEKNMGKFGRQTGITQYEMQTLHYTLSDVVASLASGISPMTILAQQGGQVRDVFGSFGNVFSKVGSLITVTRVVVGGLAAALGTLAYGFYEGSKQSKAFADSLVLSGNYAGQTEGSYNRLAKEISASGEISRSAAREFTQALISTGEIGPGVLSKAAEASALYGKASKKTADDVAKDFATMSQGVEKWATEHNRSLNFLTAAQIRQIKAFEESGKAADAQGIVYEALIARLKGLEPNLGAIERTLRGVTNKWHEFWDAAYDVGRTETIDDKLAKVEKRIAERAQASQTRERAGVPQSQNVRAGEGRDLDERNALLRQRGLEIAAAAYAATQAEIEKKAVNADAFVEGFLKRAKSVESLQKELKKAQVEFDALARAGTPVSEKNQKIITDQIREDFKPPQTEADQVRKAEMQKALKNLEDQLQRERDALTFHDQYLQGVYNNAEVSLKAFYDEKRATAAKALEDEISNYDAQIAALKKYLAATRDPSERVATQSKIDETQDKVTRARLQGAQAIVTANQVEQASYRDLNDKILEFRAQLKQLGGDEYGAAQLRAQAAIESARRFAAQTGGAISNEELARQRAAIDLANQFAEVQRATGVVTAEAARAEELFAIKAERSGASLRDTEQGVAELRRQALDRLRELAAAAQKLAENSTDPRIKAFAEDLALQYEKAAEAVEPALQRLRDANKSLASSIAGDISGIFTDFKKLPAVVNSVISDINKSLVKIGITDPLEKQIQGLLRGVTEGNGAIGSFFKDALGIGGGAIAGASADTAAAVAGQAAQATALTTTTEAMLAFTTTGVVPSTTSLELLAQAASAAAASLSQVGVTGGGGGGGGLGSLAGLFGDGGGTDFLAGIGLADGTNRVPFDGFKATLHKDEAVVPAKYNPALGGGSARPQIYVNVKNEAGDVVKAEATETDDGGLDVLVRRIVRDENAKDVSGGGGPISRALSQRGVPKALPRRR